MSRSNLVRSRNTFLPDGVSQAKRTEPYRSAYRATKSAKTCTTSKSAANKQTKRQGNVKGPPTEQPKAQKHAQPANVRPISKQKHTEPYRSAYRTTKSAKTCTTSKRAANKRAKRQGNAKGARHQKCEELATEKTALPNWLTISLVHYCIYACAAIFVQPLRLFKHS